MTCESKLLPLSPPCPPLCCCASVIAIIVANVAKGRARVGVGVGCVGRGAYARWDVGYGGGLGTRGKVAAVVAGCATLSADGARR